MQPTFDKIHLKFRLNGYGYDQEEIKEAAYSFIKEGDLYEKRIGDFLLDWFDNNEYLFLRTSGSTGPQKTVQIKKQMMVTSAIATGDYFGLSPGDSALMCLPANYIAGKMMLVRAMILGLDLEVIEPEALLIFDYEKHYDFCAMVPLQLRKSIDRIQNIKTIIVGGAAVPADLKEQAQSLKTEIYETYGMTETVSHIAVKPINTENSSEYFEVLPGVTVYTDPRNCLVIDVPNLGVERLVTNDIVELKSPTEFKIIGRYDNLINSGGVNVFPEQIEEQLEKFIPSRFFVSSLPDKDLGEKIVLVIEGKEGSLDQSVFDDLPKFHKPREVFYLKNFVETSSKKVQRAETMKLVKTSNINQAN